MAVYDLDRLHRQPRDLERFFDICDRAGIKDLASVAGDVDLASSDGRLMARIMGAVAAKAPTTPHGASGGSSKTWPPKGATREEALWVHDRGMVHHRLAEAQLLRQAATASCRRVSNAIARDWNARRRRHVSEAGARNGHGTTVKQVLAEFTRPGCVATGARSSATEHGPPSSRGPSMSVSWRP